MTTLLEDYKNLLSPVNCTVDWNDVDEWRKILVEGVELLNLTDEECARLFDVSRPIVCRWLEGSTSPVTFMRKFVVSCLVLECLSRLEKEEI